MGTEHMRAIGYRRHGGIECLEHIDLSEPKLGPGRLLIEVQGIGLNPLDYRIRRGEMWPLAKFSSTSKTSVL